MRPAQTSWDQTPTIPDASSASRRLSESSGKKLVRAGMDLLGRRGRGTDSETVTAEHPEARSDLHWVIT